VVLIRHEPTVTEAREPGQRWLILVYRIPSKPTRLRAATWRRLKALGAVYLQDSTVAIPATPATERAMRSLRNKVSSEIGGKAILLTGAALTGEADVIKTYNAARNDEYAEISDLCRDFLADVAEQSACGHFTFLELKVHEESLEKLRGSYRKIRERDLLGARGRDTTDSSLEACGKALAEFAAGVYRTADA
jgi:hypothetical protein